MRAIAEFAMRGRAYATGISMVAAAATRAHCGRARRVCGGGAQVGGGHRRHRTRLERDAELEVMPREVDARGAVVEDRKSVV